MIEDGVSLGDSCRVGPFAYLEKGCVLGAQCNIESHAVIKQHAVLGKQVSVGHFSVIGGEPQYFSFDKSIPSKVIVGNSTRIGEGVTIHRSIAKQGITRVGDHCFLMGNSHVAHDCVIGNQVTLANGSLLGGHVEVEDFVFIGGGAAIHQFSKIGKGAMVGGLAEVSMDVGPYLLLSNRNKIAGLNLVGLRRRKISRTEIKILKTAFLQIMVPGNLIKPAEKYLAENKPNHSTLGQEFACFFANGSSRGFARYRSKS